MKAKELLLRLSATAILAFGVSCAEEEDNGLSGNSSGSSPDSFKCWFQDEEPSSKAAFADNGRIGWSNGDRIAVWCSTRTESYLYSGSDGAFLGTFKKEKDTQTDAGRGFSRFYSLFPYSEDMICGLEGMIGVTIPGHREYTPGVYDIESIPSAATTYNSETTDLRFSKLCGYLALEYHGEGTIKKISLSGNDGEKLSGNAKVSFKDNVIPSIQISGPGDSLEIDINGGLELIDNEDRPVLIALPPMVFKNGFTAVITMDDTNVFTQTVTTPVSIERNTVTKAPSMSLPQGYGTEFLSFKLRTPDGRTVDAVDVVGPSITVCVPRGTSFSSLVAEFAHTGAEVLVGTKKQRSGVTANNFSKTLTYTVKSMSGTTRDFSVSVIDVDLPVIYVGTEGHAKVADKVNWHLGSRFVVVDTDGTMTDYGPTGIKGRGNSSWNYAKKPYAIKFETRPQKQDKPIETLLGMPGHKRWCLLSNCMGYYYGNIMGYEVGRRSAMEWSPHARFVELVLNGEHKGLYTLVEQVKIDKKRIPIKEKGAFLLSYDTTMDETYRFRSTGYNMPVMVKFPDDDEMDDTQFAYIKDYINGLEASLKSDSKFKQRDYRNWLDTDSFIAAWMTKELAGRKSNGTGTTTDFVTPRSVYYYKAEGGLLKAGPCWDFDVHFLLHQPQMFCMKCQYYGRLFEDSEFKKRTVEMWPQFKENLLGNSRFTNIVEYVDSLYKVSAYSAARDTKMWTKWSSYPKYTAEEQRDHMKEDLTERIKFMDEQINSWKY